MKTRLFPFLLACGLMLAAPFQAPSQCLFGGTPAVAGWKGEGDSNDLFGLFPATWVSTADYVPGKVGSAFHFNGTSYLRVSDADALSFGGPAGAMTLDAWVNPTVWSGTVLAKGSGGGMEYSLSLNRTNGSVVFAMGLADFADPLLVSQVFTAAGGLGGSNHWHHLAGVYQAGAALAVFLDGVRVGTTPLPPTRVSQNTTSALFLGRFSSAGPSYVGHLDEVYLYPVALSDQDIQSVYAAGSLGKCVPTNCVSSPPGLVAWWPGDGDAQDAIGKHSGTVANGVGFAPGKVGPAFQFDNWAQHVDIPYDPALYGLNQGTLEMWVKIPDLSVDQVLLFDLSRSGLPMNASGQSYWGINYRGVSGYHFLQLAAINDATYLMEVRTPVDSIPDTNWHHVAVVAEVAAPMRVYIDGVSQTLDTPPNVLGNNYAFFAAATNANTMKIHGLQFDSLSPYSGPASMDEVSVFDRALSPTEIQALYAAGSHGKCPPACVAPPAGFVAWWPGEGNAMDLAGHYPGTLFNGATYTTGKVGLAFSFDGVDDYMQLAGSLPLAGPRTVEAWVFPHAHTGLGMPILSAGVPGAGDFFGVAGTAGDCDIGPYELFLDHWGSVCLDSGLAVIPNAWNHVAFTYDGVNVRFYLNGVAGAPVAQSLYDYDLNTLTFGGNLIGGTTTQPSFDGLLDEVTLYNRALSPAEIQLLYGSGSLGKCAPDSDGDGFTDAYEIAHGMNPYDPPPTGRDRDGDGLTDEDEVNLYHTNPDNPDTDGDGETDGMEVQVGTDPRDPGSVLRVLPPVPIPPIAGGGWRICWISQPGTTYELQCADLTKFIPGGELAWTTLSNLTTRSALTCVVDRSGHSCLYRVRIVGDSANDTLPPVVSPIQFLSYTPDGWAALLSVNARDLVGVTRVQLLDGNTVLGSATHRSGSAWGFSWNLRTLFSNYNGRHYLRARAFDAAGNVGYSPTLAFDVNVGSATSCLDVGRVHLCADGMTVNNGVYSFSGHIRVNGITLNAGATLTASGGAIAGAGGVNVPGLGTVFDGAFEIDAGTGWLTLRPGVIAFPSAVLFNTDVRFIPRTLAVNVFTGAIQGGGAVTVRVPGHAYGDATFDGGVTFDPVAARVTVSGTLTMGSTFSGNGSAVLSLSDSTFTLSGNARFQSANDDVYTVSNGVATLRYTQSVPTITVSGLLGISDDITVQVQGVISVDGAVNLALSNGHGRIDGFGFAEAGGTLTRPAGLNAIITLQFSATLLHPSLTDYHVVGMVRSTGDIDITGTGQATLAASLSDVTVVGRFNPLNVHLSGNMFSHTVSAAISGTLLTPSYLHPVNFTGLLRADGSIDVTGSSDPYSAETYSGLVPPMDAPNLTFEERLYVGCYQLFGRKITTRADVRLHLTRTADVAGGVSTLSITAVVTTPGLPVLTLTGVASTTGAISLTGALNSQRCSVWGYQVDDLACAVTRSASGAFTFTVTGGTLVYTGLGGVAVSASGSVSSDGSGFIDFQYNSCTLRGYRLGNVTLRLAQDRNGGQSLTLAGSAQLEIPGFAGVTALVSGAFNSDGTFLLRGATSSALTSLQNPPINSPVNSMAAGSTATLTQAGLTIDGTVSGGIINDFTAVTGTARLNVPFDGNGITLTGCIDMDPLVFVEFRLESNQPGGRFTACFGPGGLTFPAGARLLYRGVALTTSSLAEFTLSPGGGFTIPVDVSKTLGARMDGFHLTDLSFVLRRRVGALAGAAVPVAVIAEGVSVKLEVPNHSPGFSVAQSFGVYGILNGDGTFSLSGTSGSSLTLSGLPVGAADASAANSVSFRDTGLTVSASCSGGLLGTLPAGFVATATLTVDSGGGVSIVGSVSCSPISGGVISLQPASGANFVGLQLDNNGLHFTGAQVRVSGAFSAAVALPAFTMGFNGTFSVFVPANSPVGFTVAGYGVANVSFTFTRSLLRTMSIASLACNLNLPGFNQRLTGSITSAGVVTLDFAGTVTLGGFGAADGQLHLRNTGLSASGTLDLNAAGTNFGQLTFSDTIGANGVYTLNGSATLNIGGYSTTSPAALKVSPTGVCNGDNPYLAYGALPVRLPNYCLTTQGISLFINPTASVDSDWKGFGGDLNGRAAGTVSLSIALDGTVSASFSWTMAYWFDRFDCNCHFVGPLLVCDRCPRPELNDSKLNAQKWSSSGSIRDTGEITLNHSFGGVNVTAWDFDLW